MEPLARPLFSAALMLGVMTAKLPAVVLSYTYDAAGRLTAVTYDGDSRTGFGYDRNGNLVSRISRADLLPALAGTFNGLVTHPMPTTGNTGPITLKLLADGGFSGSFTVGVVKSSFRGSFNDDGTAAPIVVAGMTLNLVLDVVGSSQGITGTLTVGGVDSNVALGRAAYQVKSNPLPAGLVGKFTALLAPTDPDTSLPQGDGYATGVITAPGGLRAVGKLPDGAVFTQSTTLAGPAAAFHVFASLYQKAGHLQGVITFNAEPETSDFSGQLTWLKPVTSGPMHPGGFTTEVAFLGSRYGAPIQDQRLLVVRETPPNIQFRTLDGDLTDGNLVLNAHLGANHQYVISPNPVTLKIKTVPGTGLTTGTFKDGGVSRSFGGVVFQKQNVVSGFVLGPTRSGAFEMEPQ